ncbi:MAG: glycosyltransferase family 2 protein [Bacteroidetes bacterium]|nr:glycosyltransferase family 2 protein [Bacteroidota bacterium]
MGNTKVAIVILNWNGKRFLEKFLPFLVKYNSANAEIIIADNASSDDSIDFLQSNYPEIRIIRNNENGGFAKGYNDAFSQIDSEYYVLLNSDIEVTPNWIDPVIELMDKDKTIAACQPKIRSYYNKDYFEYAGAAGGFIDKYGYPFCRGRIFQSGEKDEGQYNNATEIFWATGACMFVRSELYHKSGGLDNDFFAHMEEIDFCWRQKNAGYKIMYCPDSLIFHIGGGTLPKNNPKKTYLNFRNNFFLLFKNLPSNKLFPVFFIRLFLDGIAGLKFLAEGHFKDFIFVIKAHFAFYFSISKLLKKRRISKHVNVSCIYNKLIVSEYYIKNKKTFNQLDEKSFS